MSFDLFPLKKIFSGKIVEYAELVKFEHTIFALPFALSAMILACPPMAWPSLVTVLCVLGAMVGGRTFAMAINRLIDAEIDAKNPRTAGRSIPAGRVKKTEAWGLVIISALFFIASTWPLPLICKQLLPLAFLILILYSYVKRFSSLAHLVLGVALGSSAVGGWLAVSGKLSLLPVLFGFAVVFWVSGFDIIYACQDEAFDRSEKLHSLPVALGVSGALLLSRIFHGLCVLLLIFFAWLYPYSGVGLWTAVALTGAMLAYEHWLIRGRSVGEAIHLEKVNEAFFSVNGKISMGVFLLILFDHMTTASVVR
ncbi:MAG: UbiA-like polyprenyltransferase [Vampirovibrionales bacterium]|nr:UbiA-like polyprenyltransferase [Vampirovibrionales bacterium]